MIFIGHPYLPSISFYHIFEMEDIIKTPANSVLYTNFKKENLDIIEHFRINKISFALSADTITSLLYSATLGASYVVVPKQKAKIMQDIVENYLLEIKVLTHIDDEKEIEELALLGIDGVVFPSGIVKIS